MFKHTLSKAKFFSIPVIFLLIASSSAVSRNVTHAQQPTVTKKLPSDLILDLNLAQQNPAPDQKQIVQSETKQAEIVTNTGEAETVVPQDAVAPEVETESEENAINPEQTTSEQVITKPEQVNEDDNGTPVPTESNSDQGNVNVTGDQPTDKPTDVQLQNGVTEEPGSTANFVPGTTVTQPNDNAAPSDNSTNPNLPAPTETTDNQPSSAPVDQQNINPQQSSPATQENQQVNQPTDSNTSGDSSVQGASTGPSPFTILKEKILNIFVSIFTGNKK